MSIAESIQKEMDAAVKLVSNLFALREAAEASGLSGEPGWISVWDGKKPTVNVDADLGIEVQGDIVRKYLPLVGKFEKGYGEMSDSVILRGESAEFVLAIWGKRPETCRVEVIEEDVDVPMHREVQKKFRLVGNCGPVLAGDGDVSAT
jgi:hypothetical protein